MKRILNIAVSFFVLFFLNTTFAQANAVKVLNFSEFESYMNKESDTIYVINFWATWCAPCVREIPVFEQLNQKYSDEKLRIILVSLDFPNQLESRLLPFVERMEMKNEVILLDAPRANQWIPIVSESWTGAIPATLIYKKETRIFLEKELHFEEIDQIITQLLN
jgi:thiol-disulfide isomerase/thioredoxin